ncbi:MAG: hypothetical protein WC379_04260 [Methanoregula sp.]|jgi:hypothetical protein
MITRILRKLKRLKKAIIRRHRKSDDGSQPEDPEQPDDLPKEKRD